MLLERSLGSQQRERTISCKRPKSRDSSASVPANAHSDGAEKVSTDSSVTKAIVVDRGTDIRPTRWFIGIDMAVYS